MLATAYISIRVAHSAAVYNGDRLLMGYRSYDTLLGMSNGRVIVAMSGGVDSSVAALLLKNQGYEVIGVTMRLWTVERDDLPTLSKRCCSVEDIDDARRVCQTIGVRHYVLNLEKEFQQHVVDYFCQEYERGRTPHPCLACNDRLKFDFLLKKAIMLDATIETKICCTKTHPTI